MNKIQYKCIQCNKVFQSNEVVYLCPDCGKNYKEGNPLEGILLIDYDYDKLKNEFNKTLDIKIFSPIDLKYYPNIKIGHTPFYKSERLSNLFDFEQIYVKNDTLNPSGSLKDRASLLVVAQANMMGYDEIVTASTGNAASALACISAAAGKKAIIFAPANAPKAKLIQILQYGAQLIRVNGTYDDSFKLSLEYSKTRKVLNRNTAYNPFTIEGKKTVGLEIFVQNYLKAPDAILIPVGDGVILSGVYKAFKDLYLAKLIPKIPKLIAIQAENSAAIYNYFKTGKFEALKSSNTVADSISVSVPSAAHLAKMAIEETNGEAITVSDEDILKAQKLLAENTGIFVEPSSASVVAGLIKIKQNNLLNKKEQVVLLLTGSGLKDIEAAEKILHFPEPVENDINKIMDIYA
jgi:threonine synthase